MDFTSVFFNSFFSGFAAESDADGFRDVGGAAVFFSTAEVDADGLESSASLDAALIAAAPRRSINRNE